MSRSIRTGGSDSGSGPAAMSDRVYFVLAEMRTAGFHLLVSALLCAIAVPTCSAAQLSGPEATLPSLIESGRLPELRWPDFSEYRAEAEEFYGPTGFAL